MRHHIFLPLLIPLFASCEKELDFTYHDVESQYVIEADVSQSGTIVRINMTTPMGEAIDIDPVRGADVVLHDITDGSYRNISFDGNTSYSDPAPGVIDHNYRLSVNIDGRHYEAESLMRRESEIKGMQFQWVKMPYDYVAALQISFTDAGPDHDYYWIRLKRNGEPYMWLVSDDSHASGGIIHEAVRTSRKDLDREDEKTALRDGDIVSAEIATISSAMYDYLIAIQSDSNGPRMFSGDFCLGYFLASPLSRSEIIFRPDEM